MASSSSTSSGDDNKRYQYDVFLSFSGEDTRRSFVDHLNEALQRHSIRTFKDDERLQKGKEIKEELLKSIEDSKFCVIVFSKKYASSSWCLDELVKIMECHKTTDQTAFPVFYDVEPSEVRKQSGSVGEAFSKHTKKVVVGTTLTRNVIGKALVKHSNKKLGKWRKALKDAADLCGWELKNTAHGHEAKVIKLIVERISLELRSINVGLDHENLIGMKQRMQDLDPYLEIGTDDVRVIGIKGMGGAGKTTLARAIFDKISNDFEGRSFVENVRENSTAPLLGLKKLQEQVLADVLNDKCVTVSSVHEGTNLIKTMLCGKKVLLVLDDVDHKDQLDALAGNRNWFKSGSRIIITTRDEQVLIAHRVKWIRDVNLLSKKEAIRLFRKHAFPEDIPTEEYEMQSLEVVRYAAGLPLTIKVLGSFLCGKSKLEWIDALARLRTIPLEETLKKLELGYESLEDDYKEIFLDVVCFHRYRCKDDAISMLESCGLHARNGLRVLEQKSLITYSIRGYLDNGDHIEMHDHIVEMGKNIIRRKHPYEPNKHSRLWVQEEIENVLANGLGTKATRCIYLEITPDIVLEGLRIMKKLRCLVVNKQKFDNCSNKDDDCVKIDQARQYFPNSLQYLYWYRYPHWCIPKTFEASNLVTLEMSHSKIIRLWEGGKVMKKLKFLTLGSTKLRSLDLGLTPNLERLHLSYCPGLVKLYVHGGCLKSLVDLYLSGIPSLKSVSFIKELASLEVLHISDYSIAEIPSSIGNLRKLVSLIIDDCYDLKSLPGSICSSPHLRTLYLQHTRLEELPKDLGRLECLENLDLSGTYVNHLPGSICMLKHLKTLLLKLCHLLEKLPKDVGQLESLVKLDLENCYNLRDIPNSLCKLKHLKELNLEGCMKLHKLPDELGDLVSLQFLDIRDTSITHLPMNISLLKGLKKSDDDFIRLSSKYYPEKKLQVQDFQHLRTLALRRCVIEEVPEALGQLECLEELDLSGTHVKHLPDTICILKHLKNLFLESCVYLEKLPDDVGYLENLEGLYLSRCYSIRDVPSSICMLKQLKVLDLYHCFCLEKLPHDVGQLESLVELYITRCYNIRDIPSSICTLKHLKKLELEGCRRLEKLPKELGDLQCLQELDIRATGINHIPWSSSLLKGLKIYGFSPKG